jgi:hypothetical protein
MDKTRKVVCFKYPRQRNIIFYLSKFINQLKAIRKTIPLSKNAQYGKSEFLQVNVNCEKKNL